MHRILTIFILTFICQSSFSQSYPTSEVIQKAELYLKEAVGDSLFKYFELGANSDYKYQTNFGKYKWKDISKGRKTKGKFIDGKHINFVLNHPDFKYPYTTKTVYVELDSNLNLIRGVYIDQIPKFLLKNKPSDWLSENKIDSIVKKQNLKTPVEPFSRRLEFDTKTKEYHWIIFNTLYKEKCFSDEEILHINPVSGIILKHFEERQRIMHCGE
ncbi:hypothetical protein LXD69_13435 [Flavobacterium sediminilitoris]|uniref:Outer membrane lipoprotein-sorting protein n=1 Tax=Flavobacterium sediminilitoris TaxID=2024526 RepID=A0ABY4HK56_9FLAO|nr:MULTISPECIES: hypothetical protein [Flavobacterium]UOX33036.1 hypothetical protein LXD69_13435 [Flavobacterium sediminilitoris]